MNNDINSVYHIAAIPTSLWLLFSKCSRGKLPRWFGITLKVTVPCSDFYKIQLHLQIRHPGKILFVQCFQITHFVKISKLIIRGLFHLEIPIQVDLQSLLLSFVSNKLDEFWCLMCEQQMTFETVVKGELDIMSNGSFCHILSNDRQIYFSPWCLHSCLL